MTGKTDGFGWREVTARFRCPMCRHEESVAAPANELHINIWLCPCGWEMERVRPTTDDDTRAA